MDEPKYTKGKEIQLKRHPRFDETWVKERIVGDTALLGLGNLKVRDIERIQKRGRLDLLLVDDGDEEDVKWYEVEVQLGERTPATIIRTIESNILKPFAPGVTLGSRGAIRKAILPLGREFPEFQTHAKATIPQCPTVNDAPSALQLACLESK